LILKIDLHYTAYREKMQTALGPEQICETVYQYLSMAYKNFVLNQSLFQLENIYDKFGFGLKSIHMELKRTTWAFNRFSTSGIVVGLDVDSWLKTEKRSFVLLVKSYRKQFFPGILSLSCPFRLKLIE